MVRLEVWYANVSRMFNPAKVFLLLYVWIAICALVAIICTFLNSPELAVCLVMVITVAFISVLAQCFEEMSK